MRFTGELEGDRQTDMGQRQRVREVKGMGGNGTDQSEAEGDGERGSVQHESGIGRDRGRAEREIVGD